MVKTRTSIIFEKDINQVNQHRILSVKQNK